MNAPYDDATPMWWPKLDKPDATPAIASSQMPPIDSLRASGLEAAS
jgi:hypothetical protein